LSFWSWRAATVGDGRPPFVFRYTYAPRVHTALMIGATGLVGSQLLEVVARAMVNAALDPEKGTRIYTLDELFDEAERPR